MPTILTKRSNTPGAIPATANLTNAAGGAELAVNTADKRIFTINSSSAVVELGTNPASLTCADVSATVLRAGSATITNLIATTATVSDLSATVARISSLTISSLSLSNATFGSATITNLTSTSATITNLLATTLTVSGVGIFPAGSAASAAITTTGDTNTGIFFPAADTIAFTEGGVESARFDSSGNFGIGTSSPTFKLDVASSGGSLFRLVRGTVSYGAFLGATEAFVGTFSNNNLLFITNDTTKATLDTSGNLGLGVTPSAASTPSMFSSAGVYVGTSEFNGAANATFNSGWKYIGTGQATRHQQVAGEHRFFTAASGTAGNTITFTQAMTLDSSSRLGVNTGSGSLTYRFTAAGTQNNNDIVSFNTTTSTMAYLSVNDSYAQVGTQSNIALAMITNNTERARITSGGDFYVGTTTAFNQSKFSFNAGAARGMGVTNSDTSAHVLQVDNTSAGYNDLAGGMLYISQGGATETGFRAISVYTNSGARFAVRGDGTIYSTNTTVQSVSDERFKENIRNLDSGLSKLLQVKPRRFDWKQGRGTGQKNVAGFIAQEIELVFPELVDEFQDGIEDKTLYKSVGYSGLIPTLVKAIQEQQAMINDLKAKVAALESK
jgi:hypothetical protein